MDDRDVRSYYNSYAENYDNFYQSIQLEKLNHILPKLQNCQHVIDLGAGTGILSQYVMWSVIGIDISYEMLRRGVLQERPFLGIAASITHLPIRDQSSNCIISMTTMQNVADVERGITELIRIGSKKCIALITVLKKSKQTNIIMEWLLKYANDLSTFEVPPEDLGFLFKI